MSFHFGNSNQFHLGEISDFSENYSCCGNFNGSVSNAFYLGASYGISIFDRADILLSANYRNIDGRFSNSNNELLNFGGEEFDGEFEYNLNYKLSLLNLGLNFQYEFLPNFYSRIGFGLNYLQNSALDGQERLVRPNDIGFFSDNDSSRIRNQFSDDLASSVNPNISLLFGYSFPLNKTSTFEARPQIGFNYIFPSFGDIENWNIFEISYGLSTVYYINKKNPSNYFPQYEIIDSLLFVTAIPLTDNKELTFEDYIVTNNRIINNSYSFPGIGIEPSSTESSNYSASHSGISFLYDYTHLDGDYEAFVDLKIGFKDTSIPAIGKSKNKIDFYIDNVDLGNLSDTISYRLRVIGKKETRIGPWINKKVNKAEKREVELTYFIGDYDIDILQLDDIDLIDDHVLIYSDSKELLQLFKSYFETMGIKAETKKMKEIIPGIRSVILRQQYADKK